MYKYRQKDELGVQNVWEYLFQLVPSRCLLLQY